MRLKLKIEPIPASTWGLSLANRLPRAEWDEIRQKTYRAANYLCEICGAGSRPFHCHEVWAFDEERRIQRLVKFVCLCDLCHDCVHFGRTTQVKPPSYIERCIGHWCGVNRKTRVDFARYMLEIKLLNKRRADRQYIVKVGRRILC